MRLNALVAPCLLVLACANDEPKDPPLGAGGAEHEANCDGRGVRLAAGHTLSTEEGVTVELASLLPESPVQGDNTWELRLTRDEEPLAGATLRVLPWMPDHEHASTKIVQVRERAPGSYELSPVYLGMPGYWEVGVDVALEDEQLGSVGFDLCLEQE